jgi:hypothetical protein
MHGAAARLGDLGRITADQHPAEIQHEMGHVGRHHCSGWHTLQRDLHERVLHGHRHDPEHPGKNRSRGVWIDPRAGRDAEHEKGGER